MEKQKLLLHCCCAPCSSAILEHLSNYFDITLFFYNPNIKNFEEYEKRFTELEKFLYLSSLLGKVKLVKAEYDPDSFYTQIEGLEYCHEGGRRCKSCYTLRLSTTANYALENDFKYFSTTLTISPYKDSAVINSIGTKITEIEPKFKNLMYMPFDFGFLYTRSLDLCKAYGMYEQEYCGCEYSM